MVVSVRNSMTFAIYIQNGSHSMDAPTLGGRPIGEPQHVPRYVVAHVIIDIPEGTTKEEVAKKWWSGRTIDLSVNISAESECPDDVKAQLPDPQIRCWHWSEL
jgi:hypothetical protein